MELARASAGSRDGMKLAQHAVGNIGMGTEEKVKSWENSKVTKGGTSTLRQ